MNNKLSELSKAVGFVSDRASAQLKEGDPASIRPFFDVQGSNPLYSQEYVSALLAELEAKDKRIRGLEKRLATPVRLPEKFSMLHRTDFHEDYHSTMAFKSDEVFGAIRAAGFKVEGDEQ